MRPWRCKYDQAAFTNTVARMLVDVVEDQESQEEVFEARPIP